MIRFIHAADLHLDTPFKGLEQTSKQLADKLREAPFESFAKLVDLAIEKSVDFVLLAGDLYNTKRINIKAQSLFIDQLNRLKSVQIPVYLIHGNHDFLTEEAKTLNLPYPDNVHQFGAEVETVRLETTSKERVAITGFSYDMQWVFERKINDYPNRLSDVDLQIGLLHGQVETMNAKEANYAPFTIQELREKNYDYWALGHVHQRQEVSTHPNIHYPGNIQGLHRNELGEKGCLYVEWTPRQQSVQFISTAPIIWEELELTVTENENIASFIQKAKEVIVEKNYQQDVLLNLQVKAEAETDQTFLNYLQSSEFKNQISHQLGFDSIWVTSIELTLHETSDQLSLESLYPNEWEKALNQLKETSFFDELTENIFNQIPSKFLNTSNTEEYRAEMIKKAIAKLYLK